jgi:Ser/Thr protein kinase RdoA (MazF antagonist)
MVNPQDGWDPYDLSRSVPSRRMGEHIVRRVTPWTPTNHALLRHLEQVGFEASPRVVAEGLDGTGHEVLTWIEGDVVAPQPWTEPETVLWETGRLLRRLHEATASFQPPPDARWSPWPLREHGPGTVISHCNVAPWNLVIRGGKPVGLVEWRYAGPTDRLNEIAVTGWYCAQLHDDDVAGRVGLPGAEVRAAWLTAFLDGYQLPKQERVGLVTRMIEFAIRDTAGYARYQKITPETTADRHLWLMSWQIRAADWQLRHRQMLQNAIER